MSITTYYETLGVSRKASLDEIKSQYKNLAKQYHPDVNPKSADTFREILEAYEVLSNPTKRASYDNMIKKAEEEASHKQVSPYTESQKGKKSKTTQGIDPEAIKRMNKQVQEMQDLVDKLIKTQIEEEEKRKLDEQFDRAYERLDIAEMERLIRIYELIYESKNGGNRSNCDFETDMYYKDPHAESIFTVIYNWCEYRFENAFAAVWNRNFIAILGVLFVYTMALPLMFAQNILFFMKPRQKKFFGWHWITHVHYLMYKNNLAGTIFWTCLLAFMFVTKTIFTILCIIYWIFKNIIKCFLLPIAIILAAIIRTFGRAMLVSPRRF